MEQDLDARRSLYAGRWHRSPSDFAVRVDLSVPEKVLQHGIQVDDGTLALLFQDGKFQGTLDPGYHAFDTFAQRLIGLDAGKEAHAILLDTQGAEVDFEIDEVPVKNQVPITAHVRLLFKLQDAKLFADKFLQKASSFSTEDFVSAFKADVKAALQAQLKDYSPDDLIVETQKRELIEAEMLKTLNPTLAGYGLEINGVRLADFGGSAIDYIREKLGDIHRSNREFELNRRLRDAVRSEKVDAFRDEEQLKDYYEQVSHEFGFKSADREQERRRFMQIADHQFQLEGLGQDYELRRAEIMNRLDEQRFRHRDEIVDVHHQLEINRAKFQEDFRQNKLRIEEALRIQKEQAIKDREVGEEGLKLLEQVVRLKLKTKKGNQDLDLEGEKARLALRGGASVQALLSTLSGEQGDRLLRFVELQMRAGSSVEQALAMVVDKSPEIAPSIAEALKAKYAATASEDAGSRRTPRRAQTESPAPKQLPEE
ncbi:MAG: SPFH domain-containing protein [Chthoniobacteraceae bacterium]